MPSTEAKAYTVSELTRLIKGQLEGSYPEVWVEGQVTNYRGPATSGHRYFSLKDEGAQVRAVLFKGSAARGLAFELEEGQQVLALGRISVYEPRGEYQLVASELQPRGLGALQVKFEQLKKKLEAEGLFEASRKKKLPRMPSRVAVITSPTGAVIRDILHVTGRRCPWVDMLVLPVKVQGEGAKEEIAAALRLCANRLKGKVDLVLLARGGGSLEDLWAFNEEAVARAIADCPLPVISAVGHEVDFTIADFVADFRAPTPSAAAEILSPSREELLGEVAELKAGLLREMGFRLQAAQAGLRSVAERLARCHPRNMLEAQAQRLDELGTRMQASLKRFLSLRRERLAALAGKLQALSPLAILARGYAACFDEGGRLVRDAAKVKAGDSIEVKLGKGTLSAAVKAARA